MDVGRFVRRKTELWAWIVGPVALIWLTHAGVLLYHLMAESTLAGLEAHQEIVPRMIDSLDKVDERLGTFTFQSLTSGESEATAGITKVLDSAGARSGFVISSIRWEKSSKRKKKGFAAVQVSVIGAGELIEVIRFLDNVQQPQYLIDVERANLNIMAAEKSTIYSARFVFRCYNVAHSETRVAGYGVKDVGGSG